MLLAGLTVYQKAAIAYAAAYLFFVLFFLALAVDRSFSVALIAMVGACVAAFMVQFQTVCPECRKSPSWNQFAGGWFGRKVWGYGRFWPEKICSKCSTNLNEQQRHD
ncbi:MAG: hypothetical protein HKN78_05795 [Sphingomonadaceae bacterium]|nr:hypothetical protein [Sphingomonadaceae bacterium]